jgi:beta-galactosidase
MKRTSLKDGWIFARQGKSRAVSLPHTWTALDGQDGGNSDDRGLCTYERKLPAQVLNGQSLYLEFEAANAAIDVFVNGVSLATHKGGTPTFRVDITHAVKRGEASTIRVDIDCSASENTSFAGRRFDAHLIVISPVRISLDDDGSAGIHLAETSVTHARAELAVDVLLDNVTGVGATVECVLELVDANGAGVAGASTRLTFNSRSRKTLTLSLDNPHVSQSADDPCFYSLSVRLLNDGVEIDRRDIPAGFRLS